MTVEAQDVRVENKFRVDGKLKKLGPETIFYIGYSHSPTDLDVVAEAVDVNVPITDKGLIRRIALKNRSSTPVYYKLNGSAERYILNIQAVLTFNSDTQPTSLRLDNDSETTDAIVEVTIIGEES